MKSGTAPHSRNPSPMTASPTRIERRRLTVSATTPVGTSKTSADTSSAVPTSTSCSAFRCAIWIMYRAAAVVTSEKKKRSHVSVAR